MRNLSSIRIAEEIEREVAISDATRKLVDITLEDIAMRIIEEDAPILDKLNSTEVVIYMNIEMYFALETILEKIRSDGFSFHRGNNCPVCEKIHRIDFIIETLFSDWEKRGVLQTYKELCRFRYEALEPGRIIN